jgi:hypothetical protein
VLRPDQAAYGFHYRAVQPALRLHRCPIWLPKVWVLSLTAYC